MLTIRLDSPVPLNDQLVVGIRQLIATGEVRPGDELPPVRQLAADLGINLNTVARAYRELETAGLVSTARGRGTRVAADIENVAGGEPQQRERVEGALRSAIADAKLSGLDESHTRTLIDRLVSEYYRASIGH